MTATGPSKARARALGRFGWILAAVVVFSPALAARYFLDDLVHAAMVRGAYPAPRGPFDLYDFVSAADRAALQAHGVLPWWADPELRIRFFRPLSSALIWVERKLLPDQVLLFHLHSLAWWAAAVLGARALLSRVLPERAALIATWIFALAPCHAMPLAWLANREALVSLAFGTWALVAYVRWQDEGRLRDAAMATALFTLSMLGGEYAFCLAGYVAAMELTRRARLVARLVGLAPFAVPAAAYLAARAALGYGAARSGFYADPFAEPALFLDLAPRRLVTLFLDAWFALDYETLHGQMPGWVLAPGVLAWAALAGPPLVRLVRERSAPSAGAARWLFLGSLLALVPGATVIPLPRLLGASILGVAGTVGLLLDRAWPPLAPGEEGRGNHATFAAAVLGFAHLVHGPATSFLVSRNFRQNAAWFDARIAEFGRRFAAAPDGDREVVVTRGGSGVFFLPWVDAPGLSHARWRFLSETGHVLASRVDRRTLELVCPAGAALFPPANFFRSERRRMAAGDAVALPGLYITVFDVGAEGPRRARFEFDRDLDATQFAWVSENYFGFPATPPPRVGFGMPLDP
jgi:hypothetical protein